jgi:hypothetical protein
MTAKQMLEAETTLYRLEESRREKKMQREQAAKRSEYMRGLAEQYRQKNDYAAADAIEAGVVPEEMLLPSAFQEQEQKDWQVKTIEQPNGTKRTVLFNPGTKAVEDFPGAGIDEGAPVPTSSLPPGITHAEVVAARKEYNDRPAVKSFNAASDQYRILVNNLGDITNPASNVAALTTFMKSLDPTSTVTQNESGMYIAESGPLASIAAILNKISGEGGLGEEDRRNIINAARQAVLARHQSAKKAYQQHVDIARDQYGFRDPFLIVGNEPEGPRLPTWADADVAPTKEQHEDLMKRGLGAL